MDVLIPGSGPVGGGPTGGGESWQDPTEDYCEEYDTWKIARNVLGGTADIAGTLRMAIKRVPAEFIPHVQGYLRALQLIEWAGGGGEILVGVYLGVRYGDYNAAFQAVSDGLSGSVAERAYRGLSRVTGRPGRDLVADVLGLAFPNAVDFTDSGPCANR